MKGLIWFRDDLRLHDNASFAEAVRKCDEVIALYVIDEDWLNADQWGIQRCGPFRMQFIMESLQDLQQQLRALGGDLIIKTGRPETEVLRIVKTYQVSCVFASRQYAHYETLQEDAVRDEVDVQFNHTATLTHPLDVANIIEEIPDVFTDFRKSMEKRVRIRPVIETPKQVNFMKTNLETRIPGLDDLGYTVPEYDERAVMAFRGGSTVATKRLQHYFWDTRSLKSYKETRNRLIGADYSSKFSPWLAQGCISPRMIYYEVKRFEHEFEKNQSTYWLVFELLWRDYFKYIAMKYGARIFYKNGIKKKPQLLTKNQEEPFNAWINGQTGQDFIDANMLELKYTGFMSNRGRQNAASYLVHDLNVDWRRGAAWFENRLIDYDPCSNYGNWMYVAGVGNYPRPNRVFNPELQAEKYDPQRQYRANWLGDD